MHNIGWQNLIKKHELPSQTKTCTIFNFIAIFTFYCSVAF